jgi:uncharacterized membrane protein YhdT
MKMGAEAPIFVIGFPRTGGATKGVCTMPKFWRYAGFLTVLTLFINICGWGIVSLMQLIAEGQFSYNYRSVIGQSAAQILIVILFVALYYTMIYFLCRITDLFGLNDEGADKS